MEYGRSPAMDALPLMTFANALNRLSLEPVAINWKVAAAAIAEAHGMSHWLKHPPNRNPILLKIYEG